MARKVKVSTIGAPRLLPQAGMSSEDLVQGALSFWKEQFDLVLADKPDLIVVPEMCDSYDHLSPTEKDAYYAARGDRILDYFSSVANRYQCYLTYPAIRTGTDGKQYNSMRLLGRQGQVVGEYDKNHLVIDESVNGGLTYGQKAPLFECDFGTVACAICFDLNFDALRLQYAALKPDLIVFPSMFHGGLMQSYWAYSCRSYFASAVSGPSLESSILSPYGETVANTTNYFSFVTATINLDYCLAHLDYNAEKLKRLKADLGPLVTIHDPGKVGSVLISSESDEISALEMIRKYDIELLDDYLKRSQDHPRSQMGNL
jgi:predicted amidohydrolase